MPITERGNNWTMSGEGEGGQNICSRTTEICEQFSICLVLCVCALFYPSTLNYKLFRLNLKKLTIYVNLMQKNLN